MTRRSFLRCSGLLAIAGSATLLAACGGAAPAASVGAAGAPASSAASAAAPSSANSPAASSVASSAAPVAASPASSSAAATATQTGVLTLSSGIVYDTLDLGLRNSNPSYLYMRQIADSLTIPDVQGNPQPQLAESWKMIDPSTWEFKLKQGVKFSTGKEMQAEDVKWSYERILDPANKMANILGVISNIKAVEAADKYTVRMMTKTPDLAVDHKATEVLIMPQGITMDEAAVKPVGTGPWQVKAFVKGQSVSLLPFNDSWRGRPNFAQMEVRAIADEPGRIAALKSGDIDLASGITPDGVNSLKPNGFQIAWTPLGAVQAIFFDFNVPQLKDVRVRQAMNLALDRETLVKQLFNSYTQPASQLVGKDCFGYNPDVPAYPYDPEKAKSLLKEAGITPSQSFKLIVPNMSNYQQICEAVAGFMTKVGMTLTLETMDFAAWAQSFFAGKLSGMYIAASPYFPLMYPNYINLTKNAPRMHAYSNSEFDQLFDETTKQTDIGKLKQIFQQMNKLAHDDAAILPTAQLADIYAASPKVKGLFKPSPSQINLMDGMSKEG